MTNSTYTFEGLTNADGSPAPMMPFTVTWEEIGFGRDLRVTAPDSSTWSVEIMDDNSPADPRDFDGNVAEICVWTGGDSGRTPFVNEIEDSNTPAAHALMELITQFGYSDMEAIERRFSKWAALTGSDFRIKDWSSNGYVQSAWARGIALFKGENRAYVDAELEVYGQYLWGDVFGYEIEETGDSCWGFYGDDLVKSGAMDYIASSIRAEILKRREKAEQAAADLVRAKADAARMIQHLVSYKAA